MYLLYVFTDKMEIYSDNIEDNNIITLNVLYYIVLCVFSVNIQG
jgi:hypothetical protein